MRRVLRSVLAPLRVPATWTAAAHLLGGTVLGLALLLAAGAATAAGGPWVAAVVVAGAVLAGASAPGLLALERRQAAWALGLLLPTGPTPRDARAAGTARLAAWLAVRALAGLTAGALVAGAALLVALGLVLPFAEDFLVWDGWTSPSGLAAAWWLPAGVACGLLAAHGVRALGRVEAAAGARLLGPSAGEQVALLGARTRALEDREVLARDLHDSVGHAVTATMLQAAAARAVLRTDPDHAARALGTIERLGRQTMDELDRMLAVLRREGAADHAADVAGLVAELRRAGLPVELELRGALEAAAPAVREAVHRIVQEAATNVLRHAGPVPTRVRVVVGADAVEVEVRDAGGGRPGPPRASAGPGRGLAGMRERVTLLGGHVEAGRAEPRGWRVRAVLPR